MSLLDHIKNDSESYSAIKKAVKYDHLEIVKFFINKNKRNNYFEYAALLISVVNERPRIIEYLIEIGVDKHLKDDFTRQYWNYPNKLNIIKLLIKYDISMDNRILEISAVNGYLEIVMLLINNGAKIDEKILECPTRLGQLRTMKYLVNQNSDVFYRNSALLSTINNCKNISDQNIKKATLDRLRMKQCAILEYLIEIDANIHINDEYALRSSVDNDCLFFVKVLVNNGADIHIHNNYPLYTSILEQKYDITEFLLPFYNKDDITKILHEPILRNRMLFFLFDKNITKYPIIIQVYREYGIDLFDLIEKEQFHK